MYKDYEQFLYHMPTSYVEQVKKNWDFIDSIQLEPYIDEFDDLHELMDKLEDDLDEKVQQEDYLEGCLFNCISDDEFSTFIRNKYGVSYREEYTVKYIKWPSDKKLMAMNIEREEMEKEEEEENEYGNEY